MKKKIIKNILLYIYCFFCFLVYNSVKWAINMYGIISIDEILFYFQSSEKGTEISLIKNYLESCLYITFKYSILLLLIVIILQFFLNCNQIEINLKIKKKKYNFDIKTIILKKIFKYIIIIGNIFLIITSFYKIGLFNYIKSLCIQSDFIEKNYIDPKKIEITFDEKKKNLIFIYVESLESSYFDYKKGGLKEKNIIEPILELTKENINFSDSNKFGGGKQVVGTGWTAAGIIATTSGLPLKASGKIVNEFSLDHLMKGAYALGNILEDNGYIQEFMMGSSKEFGNRNIYLNSHGNYEIYDIKMAKELLKLPEDYVVWWGFEDSKLFDYAKEEILNLSKNNRPFNFSLLTANTHFPDGLKEESCVDRFDEEYSNSIYCSVEQINEFVRWLQTQDFYKDTVIVITGDHLTMQAKYFKDDDYDKRGIYNLFINTDKENYNDKNRIFTSFDIFPTVVSALGGEIEGNRLGLGTNLFSNIKTIPEEIGLSKFNQELSYRSSFYDNYLLK